MTARLKTSVETAEGVLSEEAQDRLAVIVQAFTVTQTGGAGEHFSAAELAELHAEAGKPFEAADPTKIRALYERNGVALNHEL